MRFRLIVVLFAIVLIFPLFSEAQTNNPGNNWEETPKISLQEKGFELDRLRESLRFLREETPVTGMVLIVDGKVAMRFGDIRELSYLASVRKSILALLYGKYVENGRIDLDATLDEIGFDDSKGLSKTEKRATIRDLLTARSGIYHPASNSGDDSRSAPKRGSKKPGEYFLYNNWDFNAAGAVFEKLTKKNIYRVFQEDLADPLGMQDFDLSIQRKRGDKTRSQHLAYHFTLSTRDMARIGLLMLNEGHWNGKQIVSRSWIKRITRVYTKKEQLNPERRRTGPFGYGYMWWVWEGAGSQPGFDGAFLARGKYGQYIAVVPRLNMVVAVKTKAIYRRSTPHRRFYRFLDMVVKSHKKYAG